MTQDVEAQVLLEREILNTEIQVSSARVRMILGVETQALWVKARMTQDAETQAEQIFLIGFSSFCQ